MTDLTRRQVLHGATAATAATVLDTFEAAIPAQAAGQDFYQLTPEGCQKFIDTLSNPETGIKLGPVASTAVWLGGFTNEVNMAKDILKQIGAKTTPDDDMRKHIINAATAIQENQCKMTLPLLENLVNAIRESGVEVDEKQLAAAIDKITTSSLTKGKIPFSAQQIKDVMAKTASRNR